MDKQRARDVVIEALVEEHTRNGRYADRDYRAILEEGFIGYRHMLDKDLVKAVADECCEETEELTTALKVLRNER